MNYLFPLSSMSFAYPYALLLPFVALYLWIICKPKTSAAIYPNPAFLTGLKTSLRQRLRSPLLGFLSILFVLLTSLAAARPQRISFLESPSQARNIMLALDVSRSMIAKDFESEAGLLSRINGVKQVVAQFIRERSRDRIGIVVFGSSALLLSPLTSDHSLLESLIDRIELGIAADGTAIGDGLGLALKRIRDLPAKSKAVILMTDGVNNAGQADPIKAAQVAKDLGIKVHTIGIGSDKPVTISFPGMSIFGQTVRRIEFDEKTLKEIANISSGVYFNAASVAGLQDVYAEIEKLELSEDQTPQAKVVEEFFPDYLFLAFLAYATLLFLSRTVFLKAP